MTEKLVNAPIIEAIIDIKCRTRENVPIDNLKFTDLPNRKSINQIETEIKTDDADNLPQSTASIFNIGYKYTDSQAGIIRQFRRDGVTTGKTPPYDTWETFLPEAISNWNRYKEAMDLDISDVARVAVRYINRLLAPIHNETLLIQDYLTNAPKTPDETRRPFIDDFLCRMVLPIPEIDGSVILISTMEDIVKNEDEEFLPLILDIDVFCLMQKGKLESEEKMWSIINRMRAIKNEMFFNVMTQKALKLCR